MGKVTGKHLLCFLLLSVALCWAEDSRKDVRKADNDTDAHCEHFYLWLEALRSLCIPVIHESYSACCQGRSGRLFARRKTPQERNNQGHKVNLVHPARRCSSLMENCSSQVPCCDPCASCRCRLFNTICHCWRMNPRCLKKT